ncbi:MAG: energy transducer TonB [Acidobacteriota bacterium]|nr:energy transducer TonB [Acidobacteriota bacterium]
MHKKWMAFTVALGLLGSAFGVRAQESKERKAQVEVYVQQNGPEGLPPKIEMGGDNFVFVATEMSFGGKVVRGAPYSAQAVTESVQALADGNRITHKSTAQVYRDSEGRTRREQTIAAIGPYSVAGDPPQTYFINDPVAGVSYILDPPSKTARKFEMPTHFASWRLPQGEVEAPVRTVYPPAAIAAGVKGEVKVIMDVNEAGKVESARVVEGNKMLQQAALDTARQLRLKPELRNGVPVRVQREIFFDFKDAGDAKVQIINGNQEPTDSQTKKESLGKEVVEGVQAEGTRITTTIPAGAVGNEQPIQIVNENWYSPELQVVVMTTHSDPRFGTTTYRLTNIQRAEPAATLFQVPPDYTVKEGPGMGVRTMRRERRQTEAPPPPQEN